MYLLNLKFCRLIEDDMNYPFIFFINFLLYFSNMKTHEPIKSEAHDIFPERATGSGGELEAGNEKIKR
jgi:hypothetical protein